MKLIPGGSTAGPLQVFGSRGPGGVAYIGVLNCEGLSDIFSRLYIQQALLALPSLLALQSHLPCHLFFIQKILIGESLK